MQKVSFRDALPPLEFPPGFSGAAVASSQAGEAWWACAAVSCQLPHVSPKDANQRFSKMGNGATVVALGCGTCPWFFVAHLADGHFV